MFFLWKSSKWGLTSPPLILASYGTGGAHFIYHMVDIWVSYGGHMGVIWGSYEDHIVSVLGREEVYDEIWPEPKAHCYTLYICVTFQHKIWLVIIKTCVESDF